ncbi:Probable serine/threonine-protein kinase drkD [Geodia barretti]|uniref:Probable serine/threonine-protein kinase drkD n=1 Tax=Geodia barretti TaxID=519541 RepID=A0AA35R5G6_GEOBA|nr:Probable serine/threonine-protein kinase drkD [Geodia barretti]
MECPASLRAKSYFIESKNFHWTREKVGEGSFGVVYKGTYRGKQCALKYIRRHLFSQSVSASRLSVEQFERECEMAKKLSSPNMVQFIGVSWDRHVPVLISELLECSLTDVLDCQHCSVPYHREIDIALGIARGLNVLHSHRPPIVHRDLSSNNILLSRSYVVKIADLGLAKSLDNDFCTPMPGTPHYMPPEVTVLSPLTVAIDLYSYAVLLIQLETRNRPQPAQKKEEVVREKEEWVAGGELEEEEEEEVGGEKGGGEDGGEESKNQETKEENNEASAVSEGVRGKHNVIVRGELERRENHLSLMDREGVLFRIVQCYLVDGPRVRMRTPLNEVIAWLEEETCAHRYTHDHDIKQNPQTPLEHRTGNHSAWSGGTLSSSSLSFSGLPRPVPMPHGARPGDEEGRKMGRRKKESQNGGRDSGYQSEQSSNRPQVTQDPAHERKNEPHPPSPKTTGGKKTPGQSPAGTKTPGSKEKKVKVTPKTKPVGGTSSAKSKTPKSSGGGLSKKTTPLSSHTPTPQKVLYDLSHSPAPKIAAISASPSPARAELSGVSPRKKYGSLFKAQKPKLSKTERQKLKESLSIFDFGSSDSESEEEGEGGEEGEGVIAAKIQIKPKPLPPVAKVTGEKTEVKSEAGTQKRQQSNSNFRRAPVRKVIAKIVRKTTPTTKSSPKKATEGGGGGKRKRDEVEGEGGGEEVKKTKTDEREPEAADLSHYEHYPRLTRSAYRNIERLGPGDSGPTESENITPVNAHHSAPQSSQSTPTATPSQPPPLTTSQDTPITSSQQDTPIMSSLEKEATPPKGSPPPTLTTSLITHPPSSPPHTIVESDIAEDHVTPASSHVTSAEDHVTPVSSNVPSSEDHVNPAPDHVTLGQDQVMSHDPSAIFGVVEEPVSSIVHTQRQEEGPDKPVSETGLAGSEDQAMETETEESQTTVSSCGGDAPPEIRSFTPPPNTCPGSTAEAGSQTDSSGLGNGNGTVSADDTMPLEAEGGDEKMETGAEAEGRPGDLSLSETPDKPAFSEFDRHLTVPTVRKTLSSAVATLSPTKTYSGSSFIPSLSRCSTWPKTSSSRSSSSSQPEKESQLCTVVRNVRQAHECLESGENQQFFDEMEYLMDSLQSAQPLGVRCLGTVHLATSGI